MQLAHEELAAFDPARTDYTPEELEAYAHIMLREDKKETRNDWGILNQDQYAGLDKKEVFNASGVADPTLTELLDDSTHPGRVSGDGQRMYWRRHPRGRRVNTNKQRKDSGAGYYGS